MDAPGLISGPGEEIPGHFKRRKEKRMDYQTFFETVRRYLQIELGDGYLVDVVDLPKNNRIDYKGLSVLRLYRGNGGYGKVLEVGPVYQEYINGKSLKECVWMLKSIYENGGDRAEILSITETVTRWESVKDCVYPMLVQMAGNDSFLCAVPYRPYLDLAVCYYAEVEIDGINGIIRATDSLADLWGVKEGDIYKQALKNMGRAGYELTGIKELLEEVAGDETKDKEMEGPTIYAVTNKGRHFGAAAILDRNFLEKCSLQLNGSFYLLPSSIHEMVVVPYDGRIISGELQMMVREINKAMVAPEEQLSDTVYYYDRDSKEVRIADQRTDIPVAG